MRRRSMIQTAGLGIAALGLPRTSTQAQAGDDRPNILWLITDEHRWDSIAAYGRHPWMKTPNLDRLARDGTLFTQAYCQSPLCVASRVSMLTGLYPHHVGVYGFEHWLDTEKQYFTHTMHADGYAVANVGKVHHHRCDPDEPVRGEWSNPPRYNLVTGFPTFDTTGGGREAWPDRLLPPHDEREQELGLLRRYLTPKKPLIIGGRNPVSADQTMAAHKTRAGLEWLADGAPADAPFLLRMSYIYPHTPIIPPAPYDTMYDPASIPLPEVTDAELDAMPRQIKYSYEQLRVHGMKESEIRKMRACYYGQVTYVDDQLGRIIDAFKSRSRKQGRPWLILFTSDHGTKLGEHGMEEKFTFYGESVHVPLIVASSDGRIPRGEVCDDFVELVDVAPTFLNAAGVEPAHELDGRDLADTAHARVAPRREVISERQTYGRRAMLKTDQWLFEMATCEDLLGSKVEPTDRDWVRSASLEEVDAGLFNLKDDPEEIRNLARDAAHAEVMSDLRQRLLDRIFSEDRVMTNWWQLLREKAG